MASASNISNLAALYKKIYRPGEIVNEAMKRHPFLSMLRKIDDFYGEGNYVLSLIHGNPASRSATFANALSTSTTQGYSRSKAFTLTRAKDYIIWTVDSESMIASEKDTGAFIRTRRMEADNASRQIGNSLAHALHRDGAGRLGQILSGAAGATLTLYEPDDVYHFTLGMTVTRSANADGSGASGTAVVTSLNRDAGTVGLSGAIAGASDDDYVFVDGDPGLKVVGLEGWLPLSAPSATPFFGVDRTDDVELLSGTRVNNAGASIEDNVLTAAEKVQKLGGRPTIGLLHPSKFDVLVKSLGSKVEYSGAGGSVDVGFAEVRMHTPAGVIRMMSDPDCLIDRGYLLQMDTWELHCMREVPHLVVDDGNGALRQSSDDGIEVRMRYFCQLGCRAPGFNAVFSS